jgi:hypothetical protein
MKEKYCLAAYAPIFDDILPIAIAAIDLISDRGSQIAVLIPGPTNFK